MAEITIMSKQNHFELPSGRRLYLCELRQYVTYEGLLEGLPTEESNKRTLDWLIKENRNKPYLGDPFLIEPMETLIEWTDPKPYPFGKPAKLPEITCIGRFVSLDSIGGSGFDMSGLVTIWFQNEFAFPIDPTVVTKILAIDWETKAIDFEV